ncbi:MFS transporter [Nocardia africana]|uniref:MFS transporter n=1 Tax=Nocardia africana TaxID=134964 RepID=A0ABW6NCW1_9NOCA
MRAREPRYPRAGEFRSIDTAPAGRIHRAIAVYTGGGFFVDGYILGSIGLALPAMSESLSLSAVWQGALAAAAFAGIFVGSLISGAVSDKFGRRSLMIISPAIVVLLSAFQFFSDSPASLLVLRVGLGIMCGAEYALGPALLSEFVPSRIRGQMMSSLTLAFTIGFAVSYVVAMSLSGTGVDAWRWMLAASAAPAAIVFVSRLQAPESPRWLASRGRLDEAQAVIDRCFGPGYSVAESPTEPSVPSSSYRELFSRRYAARTFFAGTFWACQVFPYFALGTFLPSLVVGLGLASITGELLFNLVLLSGTFLGWLYIDRFGRRPLVIWSFLAIAALLALLSIASGAPVWLLGTAFVLLTLVIAFSANLEAVYPAEIFPTNLRATGAGFAAGFSRIGAAISTFVLPTVIDTFGICATMLMLAGVALVGFAISVPLAPETNGVALRDAGSV